VTRLPGSVLYVCAMNRVRSPMAAALTRRLYGEGMRVESSGLCPSEDVDPLAAAVMQEAGIDLTDHRPRPFTDFDLAAFDLVIALSEEARAAVAEALAGRAAAAAAVEVAHWPVADPTLEEGSREQRLAVYRHTRRELEGLITGRFGPPPEWE
jgi:protein-tyrosine-phosphatase